MVQGECLISTSGGVIDVGQAQSHKTAAQEYDSVNEKTQLQIVGNLTG
jgi:hypothetical protein